MGDTKIKFKPSIQRRLICAFKTVLIICRLAHNGAAQDFEGTIKLIIATREKACAAVLGSVHSGQLSWERHVVGARAQVTTLLSNPAQGTPLLGVPLSRFGSVFNF